LAAAFLCGGKKEGTKKTSPGPFLASASAFLPGQQENGSERPTNLEKVLFSPEGFSREIQNNYFIKKLFFF
jgi:hypothetical protein